MATTIQTPRAMSKTQRARAIFSQMTGFSRALVIERYQRELDMTKECASTYYQNCRRDAGMVQQHS